MMRVPNGSLARTKPPREQGRHIFAYCNVSTNQVLYSLTQVLQGNSSLKQLPDAGANNNPPKLRKDLWRPLWSVTLPDGKNGLAQGMHAFKKLREYRKLHELNWEPPPELSRPTTQEEMDEIQKRLDERGGSKTETVHDIIKRNKKKLRQRMVMDQKANSIADLAAVLIAQDNVGAKTAVEQDTSLQEDREKEVAEMLDLAKQAGDGGLQKIDAQIKNLQSRIQAKKEGKDEEASNRSMSRAITALEKQRRRMLFSANAVQAAEQGMTWDPNSAMTVEESTQQRLRLVRQQIQERRDTEAEAASAAALTGEQAPDELEPEDAIIEAQLEDEPEVTAEDTTATSPEGQDVFQHTAKATMLELQMIRRLHGRPERVDKALKAYTTRQGDIDELRNLVQHWEVMFGKVLQRYQAKLKYWQSLQAAVDGGEAKLAKYVAGARHAPRTETGEIDLAVFQSRSPPRRLRIQAMEKGLPLLQDVVQFLGETGTVEETEARIQGHQRAQRGDYAEFALTAEERGPRSQVKVMGPARAYATVLAKAKVEARVAELERELERGGVVETAAEETVQPEPEAAALAEDADAQAEQSAEPTEQDLYEAMKQVRRLSARVYDVDSIPDFEAAVQQLAKGETLTEELKPRWTKLDLTAKLQEYQTYLQELRLQVPALQLARRMLTQPEGSERLLRAADAARERSVAARGTDREHDMLQQKAAAKMFETVARLREYEDLILSAPESAFERPAEEQEEAEVQETAPDAEIQETATEAQQSEANQQQDPNAEDTPPPPEPEPIDFNALLPSFPPKTTLPKKGPVRNKLLRQRVPVYTATGVTVKWNNMLDAEFAESWPQDVQHEPMGLSRHTAPKVDEEAIFGVAEFKNQKVGGGGGGYKGKRWEREMERKAVKSRVREGGVTERVLEAVVRREEAEKRAKRTGPLRGS